MLVNKAWLYALLLNPNRQAELLKTVPASFKTIKCTALSSKIPETWIQPKLFQSSTEAWRLARVVGDLHVFPKPHD